MFEQRGQGTPEGTLRAARREACRFGASPLLRSQSPSGTPGLACGNAPEANTLTPFSGPARHHFSDPPLLAKRYALLHAQPDCGKLFRTLLGIYLNQPIMRAIQT